MSSGRLPIVPWWDGDRTRGTIYGEGLVHQRSGWHGRARKRASAHAIPRAPLRRAPPCASRNVSVHPGVDLSVLRNTHRVDNRPGRQLARGQVLPELTACSLGVTGWSRCPLPAALSIGALAAFVAVAPEVYSPSIAAASNVYTETVSGTRRTVLERLVRQFEPGSCPRASSPTQVTLIGGGGGGSASSATTRPAASEAGPRRSSPRFRRQPACWVGALRASRLWRWGGEHRRPFSDRGRRRRR